MKLFVIEVSGKTRLIKAKSLKSAWKWVAEQEVKVRVATPEDGWKLAGEGVKIEDADVSG